MTDLALKYGLDFTELYDRDGLIKLDREFVAHLAAGDAALHDRLMTARADASQSPGALDKKVESELLVELAPHVEDFLGRLFGIETDVRTLQAQHDELAPLYSVKRLFVQRRAVKEVKEDAAATLDGAVLRATLGLSEVTDTRAGVLAWERRYTAAVSGWLDDEAAHAGELRTAIEYAAWA